MKLVMQLSGAKSILGNGNGCEKNDSTTFFALNKLETLTISGFLPIVGHKFQGHNERFAELGRR